MTGGRLVQIWRFPVKSMAGEQLEVAGVDRRGLVGDREWAVYDAEGRLASGKASRRFRRMDPVFELAAETSGGQVLVRLPGGETVVAGEGAADLALSDHFGEDVELAPEADVPHQDAGAVSLVGTATLAALAGLPGLDRLHQTDQAVDPRHLRANLVLETAEPFEEETWVGRELEVGEVRLAVTERIERCRMVDLAQVGLPPLEGLLQAVGRSRDTCAGVYATVVTPGQLAVGDRVLVG